MNESLLLSNSNIIYSNESRRRVLLLENRTWSTKLNSSNMDEKNNVSEDIVVSSFHYSLSQVEKYSNS